MQGDASTRAYERLVKPDGATAVLDDPPPRPDGPPVHYGKSYSALARLAENIRPFVAMDKGLRAQGFSAPEILAFDLDAGVAIIEDFGSEGLVDGHGIVARTLCRGRRGARPAASSEAAGYAADRRRCDLSHPAL